MCDVAPSLLHCSGEHIIYWCRQSISLSWKLLLRICWFPVVSPLFPAAPALYITPV